MHSITTVFKIYLWEYFSYSVTKSVFAPVVYCTPFHVNLVLVTEQAIRHEAFTHMEGHKEFVQIDHNDLFPYLLVNIGSGVSIIKVFFFVYPNFQAAWDMSLIRV